MDRDEARQVRLTLLENGFTPLLNHDKRTFLKGWPSVEVTPELVEDWARRHSRSVTTGIRVEGGLCVVDNDVNDADLAAALYNLALDCFPQLDAEDVPWLVRHGRGYKEAWFLRCDEPFSRIHSYTFLRPGTTAEDGDTAHVEVFGGASPRQFGSFGWHTRPEDTPDGEGIAYEWHDASPLDTPLSELPVVTKAQVFAYVEAVERALREAGWEQVMRSQSGENDSVRVYDLTDDMVFQCADEVDRTLDELREAARREDGLRCSASWLEGPNARRRDRCLVTLTRSGHVAVYETASAVTHVETAAQPMDYGPAIDRIGEKLRELEERRRRRIKTADEMLVAVTKMLEIYAYCPTQQNDVVPLWASSPDDGKPVGKFRLEMLPNAEEEVGPRGGRRVVNPVDVWLRHERRTVVAGLRMRPDQPRPTFEEDGRLYVNCYDPPLHLDESGAGGTVEPGLEFFEHLLPDEAEREWFLDWLAFKLRYPHVPGPGVVMVAHRTFGTGRGTLGVLIGKLFGERYVRSIPFAAFTGRTYQSQYNEWQADALVVMVNESSETDAGGSQYQTKRNTYEHLKELVEPRPTVREISVKGRANYRALSSTSYIISTNHADALPIPEHDRRFCVLRNGGTRPVGWWAELNDWLQRSENVAALHAWLMARDVSSYNPFETPPMFEGKRAMIEEGKSDLDTAFEIAMRALPGRLVTGGQADAAVRKALHEYDLEPPNGSIGALVRRLVKKELHRVGVRHGPNWFITIDGRRETVHAKTAADAALFTNMAHDDVRREVLRNGAGTSASNVLKLPPR